MEHAACNTSQSENQMTEVIKSEQPCDIPELFKDAVELLNVNAESVYSNDSKEYIVFPITRFSKLTYIRADAGLYFRTSDSAKVMKCVLDVSECKRLNDELFYLVKPINTEQSLKVSSSLFSEDEECVKSESMLDSSCEEFLTSDVRDMGEVSDVSHTLTCALKIVNPNCDKDSNTCDINSGNVSVNHDEGFCLHVDKEAPVNFDKVETESEEDVKVRTKRKAKTSFERRKCLKQFSRKNKDVPEHQTRAYVKLYPIDSPLAEKLIKDKGKNKKRSSSRRKKYRKKNSPFTCEHCKKEFQVEVSLKKHITREHEIQYKCNVCNIVYMNQSALKKHKKTHWVKGTICEVCGKFFACKGYLRLHMTSHTGDKPYQCDQCDEAFSLKRELNIHLIKHTGINPYLCQTCGASFPYSSSLYHHNRITHTVTVRGEKTFHCSYCDKSFRVKEQLERHQKVHSGEKPYKCEFCTMSFSQNCNLKTHTRTHTQEKPFSCTVCGASFSHRVSLKTHMSSGKHQVDKSST